VWVEQCQAFAVCDVLAGKIGDERRFAGAGLADDVHVGAAIPALDAEAPPMMPKVGLAEAGNFIHRFSVGTAARAKKR
jgi:hypothetical protein